MGKYLAKVSPLSIKYDVLVLLLLLFTELVLVVAVEHHPLRSLHCLYPSHSRNEYLADFSLTQVQVLEERALLSLGLAGKDILHTFITSQHYLWISVVVEAYLFRNLKGAL